MSFFYEGRADGEGARVVALKEDNPRTSLFALAQSYGYSSESTFRRAYKKYGA